MFETFRALNPLFASPPAMRSQALGISTPAIRPRNPFPWLYWHMAKILAGGHSRRVDLLWSGLLTRSIAVAKLLGAHTPGDEC